MRGVMIVKRGFYDEKTKWWGCSLVDDSQQTVLNHYVAPTFIVTLPMCYNALDTERLPHVWFFFHSFPMSSSVGHKQTHIQCTVHPPLLQPSWTRHLSSSRVAVTERTIRTWPERDDSLDLTFLLRIRGQRNFTEINSEKFSLEP